MIDYYQPVLTPIKQHEFVVFWGVGLPLKDDMMVFKTKLTE